MADDSTSQSSKTSWPALVAAGVMAAILGFAAVYVTRPQPDNAPAAAALPPADAKTADPATAFAGFVHRRPPLDLAAISFEDANGATRSLADFKGKTVLLNLWATWCGPCRKEMPSLDRLQKEMGSDTFEVVALSLDRAGREAAAKFFADIKVEHLKLYIDSTMKAGNALRALGMPTTLLIDKDGREVGRLPGPAEWDTPAAKAIIAGAQK